MDARSYAVVDLFLNTAMYAAFTVPPFLACWWWMTKRWQGRRIQPKRRSISAVLGSELLHSGSTLLIFTMIDTALYVAIKFGYTRVYMDVQEHGQIYLALSALLVIVLHYAWFYWTHRVMHHPAVFRHIHRVHHVSTDPSPFASYSFHPLEALVEVGIYILVVFVIPLHFGALIFWQLFQLAMNVMGHLGYEFFPAGANRHWLPRHIAPSTHHNLHHSRFRGNLGLYFPWWDRWMGTEFHDYHQTFDGVQRRIKLAKEKGDSNAAIKS